MHGGITNAAFGALAVFEADRGVWGAGQIPFAGAVPLARPNDAGVGERTSTRGNAVGHNSGLRLCHFFRVSLLFG